MKYTIDLDDDSNDFEEFESKESNIISIFVRDEKNAKMTNCCVDVFLTQKGMLGLGTELIRLAHKFREGKHYHLEPISKDLCVEKMGVLVAPNSCEMMICCDTETRISDYIG